MKLYIASRFGLKEKVREIYEKLRTFGHEVSFDWTEHKPINLMIQIQNKLVFILQKTLKA